MRGTTPSREGKFPTPEVVFTGRKKADLKPAVPRVPQGLKYFHWEELSSVKRSDPPPCARLALR